MGQRVIIIKVLNDRIFINSQLSIPIEQTNIPKDYLSFRTYQDIFWEVEMLEYKAEKQCLKVAVRDYNKEDVANFGNQRPKKKIRQIHFEKFDWNKLEPILTSYQKSMLNDFLFNTETVPFSNREDTTLHRPKKTDYSSIPAIHNTPETPAEPTITNHIENFWISFSDSLFKSGYVSFKKYINRFDEQLEFKIPNEHILTEFNNIKSWFAKKLKTKKFQVTVHIVLTDNIITGTSASSEHIDQINTELIESVKYQRTLRLTKEPKLTSPDKALFTAEEVFNQIDTNDIDGNVFNQSEEEILSILMEKSGTRNKKQLAYLSGEKQSENHKLRYTLNPHFGFLFLIEGAQNNHFVWELLNSHATYIWSIDKSEKEIDLQFKRVESIINTVRASGREKYKRAYKNNHQDNDLVFRAINHDHIDSELVDDFPLWKNKLNEQLT